MILVDDEASQNLNALKNRHNLICEEAENLMDVQSFDAGISRIWLDTVRLCY